MHSGSQSSEYGGKQASSCLTFSSVVSVGKGGNARQDPLPPPPPPVPVRPSLRVAELSAESCTERALQHRPSAEDSMAVSGTLLHATSVPRLDDIAATASKASRSPSLPALESPESPSRGVAPSPDAAAMALRCFAVNRGAHGGDQLGSVGPKGSQLRLKSVCWGGIHFALASPAAFFCPFDFLGPAASAGAEQTGTLVTECTVVGAPHEEQTRGESCAEGRRAGARTACERCEEQCERCEEQM